MKRALVCAALLAGCGSSTDDTTRDVALVDLTCASLAPTSGVWESSSFPESAECGTGDAGTSACCTWIELPGHTVLRLEHGLGASPRIVDGWISFSEYGVGSTLASGDALRLRAADDTFVTLENHTDQRFYLRVDLR